MATIFSGNIGTLERLEGAVRTLAEHRGRIFVGKTPSTRKEVSLAHALTSLLTAAETEEHVTVYLTPAPKSSKQTRQQKWQNACNAAGEALEELLNMQGDFTEWQEKLTDSGAEATKTKLEAVSSLEIQEAVSMIETAKDLELPQGFGRD